MKINVLIEKNGINSKGIYDTNDESILVLKGSKIRKEIAPHFKDSIYDILRNNLIFEGIKIGRASCREKCRSRWSPYH